MGDIFQKLSDVEFLNHDEIAELPISDEQVINMCITVPCRVNLRRGNLVNLVERKYKDKLSTYNKSKILKWLKINLPRLLPNPEEKYLRWKERWQRQADIEWMNRKIKAIDQLPPPCEGSQTLETEQNSEIEIADRSRTSGIETSADENTFDTVIQSQPKSSQQLSPRFSNLLHFSASTVESTVLPPPISSNNVSSSQIIDIESMESPKSITKQKESLKVINKQNLFPLIQQSEGFSSQEDPYETFNRENFVTSTQEFGNVF